MSFGYDPELPAGFQEADFEMRELEEAAAQMRRMRKRGVCQHSSATGYLPPGQERYPEQKGLKPGELICTEGCGRIFRNDEDWYGAMEDARYGG